MYAVVLIQNFDPETESYLLATEGEAVAFAKRLWEKTKAIEDQESPEGVDAERSYWSDEEMGGKIYWNDSETDYIRVFVTELEPVKYY